MDIVHLISHEIIFFVNLVMMIHCKAETVNFGSGAKMGRSHRYSVCVDQIYTTSTFFEMAIGNSVQTEWSHFVSAVPLWSNS